MRLSGGWRAFLFLLCAHVKLASSSCPDECTCDTDRRGRKRVACTRGGLEGSLPVLRMDRDVQVLVVTAPRDKPNELTLGRVFMQFTKLEEVHITNSFVPAIGENTFWSAATVRTLNLTRNNITTLLDTSFKGLESLENLHLDDNNIMSMPSATFRYLTKLRNLTLSHNKVDALVPRMFFMLSNLDYLDLSWNPIAEVDGDNFKDIGMLRKLYLSHCHLTKFDSGILRHLPYLETLDLSHNQIDFISPQDLASLRRLKILYLHGNRLTTILENTFSGHNLTILTLARNRIRTFLQESFSNLTVKALDLSHNNLEIHDPDFLRPVADRLVKLDISGNRIRPAVLSELIDRFPVIRDLSIAQLGLLEVDPEDLQFPKTLRRLNISSNHLSRFPVSLLQPLRSLEVLDLSRNKLRGLDQQLIEQLDGMTHLRSLHLNGNPWSCDLCYIPALLAWLNNSRHFDSACDNLLRPSCLKCASPYNLSGHPIQLLDEEDLEPCDMADMPALSVAGPGPHVGVIVACAILVLLLLTMTVVLVLYYRRGADYYTHEDGREDDGIYENPGVDEENGDLLGGKRKKPQIATIENMDEFRDDGKYSPSLRKAVIA